MRYFLIVLINVVFIQNNCNAQTNSGKENSKEEKITYTLDRNEPDHLRKLAIEIYPVSFCVEPSFAVSLNLAAGLQYDISPSVSIYGDGAYSYSTSFTSPDADRLIPLTPYCEFNGGLIYYFMNHKIKVPHTISIGSAANGNYITTFFFRVPVERVKKFGIEAGGNFTNSIIGSKGPTVYGYNIADPYQTMYTFGYLNNSINFTAFAAYLGVNYSISNDYKITYKDPNYPDQEHKEVSNTLMLYGDFMIPFNGYYSNTSYYPITGYDPNIPNGEYNLNKYTSNNTIGIRLGIKLISKRPFGFSMGAEFGLVPGITGAGICSKLNVGISLNK